MPCGQRVDSKNQEKWFDYSSSKSTLCSIENVIISVLEVKKKNVVYFVENLTQSLKKIKKKIKKGTRKLTSANLNANVNGRTDKNVKIVVVFRFNAEQVKQLLLQR